MPRLGIYNSGYENMTDSVDYWVFLHSIQVKTGKAKLTSGDNLILLLDAGTMASHLTVNQVANHPLELFAEITVESCTDSMVQNPRPMAKRFPKSQQANSKTHCPPIGSSYDPNDKHVFPLGFTADRIVKPDTRLEYLVRFQNTGTDTAFTVVVVDSIDANLNPESFALGAISHPVEVEIQTDKLAGTFLRFRFSIVLLPDSNTDFFHSNGFIQYRISPKPHLPLGTVVKNKAGVYFDHNSPVVTNETITTFNNLNFFNPQYQNRVKIIPSLPPSSNGSWVFPNPVNQNKLTVSFLTKGSLVLYNIQGKKVMENPQIEGTETLSIQLPVGLHLAHMKTEFGISVVKVMAQQ